MNPISNSPPKNWLLESILATILCCLPFGIVGIINASHVNSRYNRGDVIGAEKASREAAKWTKIAFFSGLIYFIAMLGYWLIGYM